jgi:hypothetical protein
MSQETQRHEITKKKVVYQMPTAQPAPIRRDIEYRVTDVGALTMDIYYPPDSKSEARTPAVVFVIGYPDPGFQRMFGCKLKEMESYISCGQLTAASGLVAITYTTSKALSHNLPITFVNYPTAPHAFDIMDDSEMSREIIRQIVTFIRFHLLA